MTPSFAHRLDGQPVPVVLTGNTIDFRRSRWGHALHIRSENGAGLVFAAHSMPRGRQGDLLLLRGISDRPLYYVVTSVEWCGNPDDMWFGEAVRVETPEGGPHEIHYDARTRHAFRLRYYDAERCEAVGEWTEGPHAGQEARVPDMYLRWSRPSVFDGLLDGFRWYRR